MPLTRQLMVKWARPLMPRRSERAAQKSGREQLSHLGDHLAPIFHLFLQVVFDLQWQLGMWL